MENYMHRVKIWKNLSMFILSVLKIKKTCKDYIPYIIILFIKSSETTKTEYI